MVIKVNWLDPRKGGGFDQQTIASTLKQVPPEMSDVERLVQVRSHLAQAVEGEVGHLPNRAFRQPLALAALHLMPIIAVHAPIKENAVDVVRAFTRAMDHSGKYPAKDHSLQMMVLADAALLKLMAAFTDTVPFDIRQVSVLLGTVLQHLAAAAWAKGLRLHTAMEDEFDEILSLVPTPPTADEDNGVKANEEDRG
jgi:hypothetical protein